LAGNSFGISRKFWPTEARNSDGIDVHSDNSELLRNKFFFGNRQPYIQLFLVLLLQSASRQDQDLFAELLVEDDHDVKYDLAPSDTAESIAAQFLRDRCRLSSPIAEK
jgi:hypothetical protein